MKRKKFFSVIFAVSIAAAALAGFSAPAGAAENWVGYSTNDSQAEWNYGEGYSGTTTTTGIYDPSTYTLTFTENVKLYGCEYQLGAYCGSAVLSVAGNDLIMDLAGYNIEIDASQLESSWIGGIYKNGGHLTVKGPGTLTVNAAGGSQYNAALMGYDKAGITITGGANVVLSDMDDNGYGIYASGPVDIEDGTLEMTGGSKAVYLVSEGNIITEGKTVTVGESAENASEWNAATPITDYKYVKISSSEETEQPVTKTAVTVGGQLLNDGDTYENGGVSAVYDSDTATLTLSGAGTIYGAENDTTNAYGAAVWAQQALTVSVADGSDITLQGNERGEYSYGISTYTAVNGELEITGGGKLTVKTDPDAANESAALYTTGDITVSGGVSVTAEGTGAKHLAANRTGSGGKITVEDNASLHMKNAGAAALFNGTVNYPHDGYTAKAAAKDGSPAELGAEPSLYSEYHIKPAPAAAVTTENIGAFKGQKADGSADESDVATGFVTTVSSETEMSIEALYWTVTSGEDTKQLYPESALPALEINGGDVKIGIIVQGLYDAEAVASAYIY